MSISNFKMPITKNDYRGFTIKNLDTKRSYEIIGNENSTRKSVWDSQKSWFANGTHVEITSPDGLREIFYR